MTSITHMPFFILRLSITHAYFYLADQTFLSVADMPPLSEFILLEGITPESLFIAINHLVNTLTEFLPDLVSDTTASDRGIFRPAMLVLAKAITHPTIWIG